MQREHTEQKFRVITDKYAVYPGASKALQESDELTETCVSPSEGLKQFLGTGSQICKTQSEGRVRVSAFWSARRTIRGDEMLNTIRKGQIVGVEQREIRSQNHFISEMLEVAV